MSLSEYYVIGSNGVIHQDKKFKEEPVPTYDNIYVTSRYDNDLSWQMANLRYGFIYGVIGSPVSVLDIGYGTGTFLQVASRDTTAYGYDITNFKLPENIKVFSTWDDIIASNKFFTVTTFFDSLEHFEDISIIQNLKTQYIVVSVPCLPEEYTINSDNFKNWKHRRPNEHLWHFTSRSLINFMRSINFNVITTANIEDGIRIPWSNKHINILTAVFKKSK